MNLRTVIISATLALSAMASPAAAGLIAQATCNSLGKMATGFAVARDEGVGQKTVLAMIDDEGGSPATVSLAYAIVDLVFTAKGLNPAELGNLTTKTCLANQ